MRSRKPLFQIPSAMFFIFGPRKNLWPGLRKQTNKQAVYGVLGKSCCVLGVGNVALMFSQDGCDTEVGPRWGGGHPTGWH